MTDPATPVPQESLLAFVERFAVCATATAAQMRGDPVPFPPECEGVLEIGLGDPGDGVGKATFTGSALPADPEGTVIDFEPSP